ncbi:MAG TPA: FkbM family methyltransferase [Puia sp.]|jgi:FkbM family methyltransferase|nr:FkbM family methyltransferase [Puia sp.]
MVRDLLSTLKFIFNHPATRNNKLAAFRRFAGWQIQSRTFHRPVVYPFVEKSVLLVQGGMTGATGNIYTGLHEFEDMMFLLHLLRSGDIFVDAGANIGSYTILASSVAGAKSISFEPVPSTFLHLKNNVAINNIESSVELQNAGVGKEKGKLSFTSSFDTMNHVVTDSSSTNQETIQVDIVSLDDILGNRMPTLIKIDTEGFEMAVLQGAELTLKLSSLLAVIVELNGSCHRYGINENDIHEFITGHGFIPISYDPIKRTYSKMNSFNLNGNTIYIKNEGEVAKRLETARKFTVLNLCV